MSRAPDERFTSLIEMQTFKRRIRENSRSQVVSSRGLILGPISEDDPKETGAHRLRLQRPFRFGDDALGEATVAGAHAPPSPKGSPILHSQSIYLPR